MIDILEIEELTVFYGGQPAVRDAALRIGRGEVVGLVGESGSGKSTLAMAIGRLLPPGASMTAARLAVLGEDVRIADASNLRRIRADRLGYVFQSPITALDPTMRIGRQLALSLRTNISDAVLAALRQVQIASPELVARRFPHQLSGGIAQRVGVAMAIARKPALLIVDEPTSALDASLTAEVLEVLLEVRREHGTSILLLSHDLAAVRNYADRVAVMQGGAIVEEGRTASVFAAPSHEYTRHLLGFHQRSVVSAAKGAGSPRAIVGLRKVTFAYPAPIGAVPQPVLHAIDLEIGRGEVLGLIGESGSGKTTIGRLILGFSRPTAGEVVVDGKPASALPPGTIAAVLQNPDWALNPRLRVANSVAEPLLGKHIPAGERGTRVSAALGDVGLSAEFGQRYPGQLSGGQRQRASIARALIAEPAFIVFDEPVSALDAAVQSQVMDVLAQLKSRTTMSALFISHDIAATRRIADRIAVLYQGEIVEIGPADSVGDDPLHPYSRLLLAAASGRRVEARALETGARNTGCRFASRCPFAAERCRAEAPQLRSFGDRQASCHRIEELPSAAVGGAPETSKDSVT